jgi:hypothetical protein
MNKSKVSNLFNSLSIGMPFVLLDAAAAVYVLELRYHPVIAPVVHQWQSIWFH